LKAQRAPRAGLVELDDDVVHGVALPALLTATVLTIPLNWAARSSRRSAAR
jgi:hypothetical protein